MLSDNDILNMMRQGKLSIEPFEEKNLTPNGYDLTIGEVFIKKMNSHIREGIVRVPPLTWFAISTFEFIEMGEDITAQLWIRSSYARRGIFASFGKVDAGFRGTLTIGCFNASHEYVEIPIGDRFCQIVFELLATRPDKLYEERSGNYQNQRGITLPD
ncbi:MAG TPA: dCTP deaminase [Thermoplasmatales archaeon]|nr:dCTP deaminase [Thermoplasmatales archaeon]